MGWFSFLDSKTPKLMALITPSRGRFVLPDPDRVRQLLDQGASPWGAAPSLISTHRGVLGHLIHMCPPEEVIDAWFKAAGNLSVAPWGKHNCPSPVCECLEDTTQPGGFKLRIFKKLMEANASIADLDTDGKSLVERIHDEFEQDSYHFPAYEVLLNRHPECFNTRAAWSFYEEKIAPHAKFKANIMALWQSAQAKILDQETTAVDHRPARPRL